MPAYGGLSCNGALPGSGSDQCSSMLVFTDSMHIGQLALHGGSSGGCMWWIVAVIAWVVEVVYVVLHRDPHMPNSGYQVGLWIDPWSIALPLHSRSM